MFSPIAYLGYVGHYQYLATRLDEELKMSYRIHTAPGYPHSQGDKVIGISMAMGTAKRGIEVVCND